MAAEVQAWARGGDLVFACAAHAPKGEGWKAVARDQLDEFGVDPARRAACFFCAAKKAPSLIGLLAPTGEA